MRWLPQAFIISALLAGTLQAGDLTLTATDNGDGTLTIGISGYDDFPPVGIALTLDPNSSQIKSLNRGGPYYDIITTFDPNSQQITAFAALSTLGANDQFLNDVPQPYDSGFRRTVLRSDPRRHAPRRHGRYSGMAPDQQPTAAGLYRYRQFMPLFW